jgi:protein-L-isoaspartate(D-aspartate) O-methyltransferase
MGRMPRHPFVPASLTRCAYVNMPLPIRFHKELASEAELRLLQLGYTDTGMRVGDRAQGRPEHAPFDKILVSAAAELCSPALIEQLRPGGRVVLPTGVENDQRLTMVEKAANGHGNLGTLMPALFTRLETVR